MKGVATALTLADYDFRLAVEPIAAAAQAAGALPFPFMLTARAHNFLYAAPSLDDTISRLQAFEKAGADVLFAPGLPDLASVRAVCAAGIEAFQFHGRNQRQVIFRQGTRHGWRRAHQSCDLTLPRGNAGLLDAAGEVKDTGDFGFLDRCVTTPELNKLMRI